jgi:CDP-paratose 2-epimerase
VEIVKNTTQQTLFKKILITGSAGLIGSEVATYFGRLGWRVYGVDNNQRACFFGPSGDTTANLRRLQNNLPHYTHYRLDIRDREGMANLVNEIRPHAIVHAAAQPSHDRAAQIPFDDFDTNAVGTLNLLQAARQYAPEAPFIHMSTNKVYGDGPNKIEMQEADTRWEFIDPAFANGIPESFSIDQCTHSLFGASKVAADIVVQEYGRYFNMPTVCLRGGCLTGPQHSGVQLHGFLNYLVKCHASNTPYTVFGYKGKQVRDNIHSYDVATFIHAFVEAPRAAAVYNIGGGKANAISILETFAWLEQHTGVKMQWSYNNQHRMGDHICYYSNLSLMQTDYPAWQLTRSMQDILSELVQANGGG